jgi:hypothetical protein
LFISVYFDDLGLESFIIGNSSYYFYTPLGTFESKASSFFSFYFEFWNKTDEPL